MTHVTILMMSFPRRKQGGKFLAIDLGNAFFNMTPKQANKQKAAAARKKKWSYIKLKQNKAKPCPAKETIKKMKRQCKECEKILANHIYLRW